MGSLALLKSMRKIIKLLVRNRRWLWQALRIFLIGNLLGFLLVTVLPKPEQPVFQESEPNELLNKSVGERIRFFYLHNLLVSLIRLFGGILFGLWPTISLLYLGAILGGVFSLSVSHQMVGFFVLGTLPHGVFELPAAIIAAAWGLKLGEWIMQPIGKKAKFLYSTLKEGVYIFLLIAVLLLIAAIIESTITPFLLFGSY